MKKRRPSSTQKAKSPDAFERAAAAARSRDDQNPAAPQPAAEQPTGPVSKPLWVQVLVLICVVLLGLWVRLEDLVAWQREPGRAFYAGQPLLTALDGLFYLTLARDLIEGTYQPIDDKRAVPDCPTRPTPPPLISCLTAAAAKVVPISLNWIAVLLPAFLGVWLFLPVYGLGRFFGGPITGTVAALFALLSPYYAYRSGFGWLDTDVLNVTFAAAAAYFFLMFGVTPGTRRYYHFLAGMITYGLFLWWWDQTPEAVTVICLVPAAVGVVFYRPSGRERWFFLGALFVGLLLLLLWKGTGLVSQFMTLLGLKHAYLAKESAGAFPNIGVSISEQVRPSLDSMAAISTGGFLTFVAALCGIVLLIWRHWKESLFLGALLGLCVLAFFYARRFAIFCAPVTALGIGFFISEMWRLRARFRALTYVVPPFVVLLIWPMIDINHAQTYWPKEQPNLVAGLALAEKKTPRDAVIWAWWDHGYTIPYWARRASVNDGALHSGDRTVFNGIPLATGDERLAANLMHFWVARGVQGLNKVFAAMDNDEARSFLFIKRVLSAGPEQARAILRETPLQPRPGLETTEDRLEFFFPSNPRPVYLFLDELLTRTSYWWFWFGSWDVRKQDGTHADYRIFDDLREEDGRFIARDGLVVDTRTGKAAMGNQTIPLQGIAVWDGKNSRVKRFNHPSDVVFEASDPNRTGAMMHREIAESVFNKLFFRHTCSQDYFRPVILNTPWYQLWEVRGESWKASSDRRNPSESGKEPEAG